LFVVWGLGWVWVGLGQLFGGLGWIWVDDMDPRTTLIWASKVQAARSSSTSIKYQVNGVS